MMHPAGPGASMDQIPIPPYANTDYELAAANEGNNPGSTNAWFDAVKAGTTTWPTYSDQGLTECRGLADTAKGAICSCAGIQWQGADGNYGAASGYSFDRGSCWLVQDCYKNTVSQGGKCFDVEERIGATMCQHGCSGRKDGSSSTRHDGLNVPGAMYESYSDASITAICPDGGTLPPGCSVLP